MYTCGFGSCDETKQPTCCYFCPNQNQIDTSICVEQEDYIDCARDLRKSNRKDILKNCDQLKTHITKNDIEFYLKGYSIE